MTQLKRIQNIFRHHRVANKLEACWFQQGGVAYQMGLSPVGLNPVQLAGYKAEQVWRREYARQWSGGQV